MAERIAHHRARRPASWRTIEATSDLISYLSPDVRTIVVEDLTLLLSNHMERDTTQAEAWTVREVEELCELKMNVVLVSNEVGMGLVPETALGRTFRDALGRVNQRAAAVCSEVYFVVAGLPLRLK
jgi:adenosylcobinamide kinase/adenosylcobinamide-phosphate guanylyltransferase